MYRKVAAIAQYLMGVSYVTIQTYNGAVYEGELVRVEAECCVVDDNSASSDMVVIRYSNIVGVSGR